MNCNELTNQQLATAWERGMCSEIAQPPPALPTELPTQNAISGSGIPLPLLAILAIAGLTWGMQKASDWGREKRIAKYRPPAALTGAHVGQDALYPSEPASNEPWNDGVRVGSGSISAEQGSTGFDASGGITEPSPWAATETSKANYQDDRTGSDVSTADVWRILKDCTFQEFQKRIKPGNIDPVPVVNEGLGGVAARDALYRWFQHGVKQQNKCCYAAFGTDGKGDGATATAAKQLFKEHLAHL